MYVITGRPPSPRLQAAGNLCRSRLHLAPAAAAAARMRSTRCICAASLRRDQANKRSCELQPDRARARCAQRARRQRRILVECARLGRGASPAANGFAITFSEG